MDILKEINKIIPEDLKKQIKELQVKFSEVQAAQPLPATIQAEPTALAAIENTLVDGTKISVDKMEVGGKVQVVTADGMLDAPDGEHETVDGFVIKTQGGIITEIATKEVETEEAPAEVAPAVPAEMSAILDRLSALESKFETVTKENQTLKNSIFELNKSANVSLSAINSILSVSAGEPTVKPSVSVSKADKIAAVADLFKKK
jgi:hypothetical protein